MILAAKFGKDTFGPTANKDKFAKFPIRDTNRAASVCVAAGRRDKSRAPLPHSLSLEATSKTEVWKISLSSDRSFQPVGRFLFPEEETHVLFGRPHVLFRFRLAACGDAG
ncbi:unnamed protein product [Merluccius merluccius]